MRTMLKNCLPSLLVFSVLFSTSFAQAPKVLEDGSKPDDWRLKPLKDLDGYFPLAVPESKDAWLARKAYVQRQLKVALGLWPMPEKTPLKPVMHSKRDMGDYTVENVYFESLPGFYVCGNLYRPKSEETEKNSGKKYPAVLSPHGHWGGGRFYDAGEEGVAKQLKDGGEWHEDGGRSPLQSRCVQLARMGVIVFHYDMIGYADSTQLSFELVHRFGKPRPDFDTLADWGFFSPQAELRLQSVMGLQAWNSIRGLDFLESLPDVDTDRLGVTGASGGGTQTFILAAIDDRVDVAFPAVMVSTAMQGGCTCENCSLLRVETGNIEIAGLFAPKPLGMTAADDWTVEMETKGYPELQKLYELLGVKDNVTLAANTQYKHNYNHPSRMAMYAWFNKHLKLGHGTIEEKEYERLSAKELSVWNDEHPQPSSDGFEKKLVKYLTETSDAQIASLTPTDKASLQEYRKVVGGAVDVLIGRRLPDSKSLSYDQNHKEDHGKYLSMAGLLTHEVSDDRQEQLPVLFLYPHDWNRQVVIWLTPQGKAGLYDESGKLTAEVQQLLDAGTCVVGVDLLFQGESLEGEPVTETRIVKNPRLFAGYTHGYNASLLVRRVHDVLTSISFMANHELTPKQIDLAAMDPQLAPIAAFAAAQAGDLVTRVAVNSDGWRYAQLNDWRDPRFLPGGAKYGDLPGVWALLAPRGLWLGGEKGVPDLTAAAYKSAGAETVTAATPEKLSTAAVEWLLKD